MKRNTAIALFAIASFAMAGNSFAQDHAVQATVPFDFTVGAKLLPSGTYTISTDSANVIVIRNRYKPIAALSMVRPESGGKQNRNDGKLVFHKYGDQYFLSEIRCDAAGMNMNVAPSKLEKRTEEARANASSQTYVAAR